MPTISTLSHNTALLTSLEITSSEGEFLNVLLTTQTTSNDQSLLTSTGTLAKEVLWSTRKDWVDCDMLLAVELELCHHVPLSARQPSVDVGGKVGSGRSNTRFPITTHKLMAKLPNPPMSAPWRVHAQTTLMKE